MSNSNGLITAPVNVQTDVYKVLGISAQGGNYDIGYACSNTHGKINRWSKKKPVHIADSLNHKGDNWWKGTNGTCGIDYTKAKANNYKDIPSKYTSDENNGWDYTPPWGNRGGSVTSPYRLEDFEGYFHNAQPPVMGFSVTAKVAQGGTLTGSLRYGLQSTDGTSLSFDDIYAPSADNDTSDLGNYYFGIIITDNTGSTIYGRVTGGKGTSWGQVSYQCTGLTLSKTYRAYPFLSQVQLAQNSVDMAAQFLTLPSCTYAEFKIVTKEEAMGLRISLIAEYVYGFDNKPSNIRYTLTITSETNMTLTNNYIEMRFSSSTEHDSLKVGEKKEPLGNITVGPDNKYTKNGTFIITETDKLYYVRATFQSSVYDTGKILPLSSILPDRP